MHRPEHPNVRRASRSEPRGRVSLVFSQNSFLDTLIINGSTGAPLYATITQAGQTVLYSINKRMTLRRVATLDWSKGGKSSRKKATLSAGGGVSSLEEVIFQPSEGILERIVGKSTSHPDHNYSFGRRTYRWEEWRSDQWHVGSVEYSQFSCYGMPSDSSSPPSTSSQIPSASSPSRNNKGPIIASFESRPHRKPKVLFHIYARELLEQVPGDDGLSELDHIVLGALILSTYNPPKARKNGAMPAGWMSEEMLQNMLWSSARPAPGEVPPLYAVIVEAVGSTDGLPPAYASRMSVDQQRSR